MGGAFRRRSVSQMSRCVFCHRCRGCLCLESPPYLVLLKRLLTAAACALQAAHLGDGWDPDLDFADISTEGYCCRAHYLEDHDCADHCMLFQAKHSPTGYGKVMDRSVAQLKPAQFKFVCRLQEGLLALEIQDGIYDFLLKASKLILHDIPACMFFRAPHQPKPPMPQPRRVEQWASLSAHALEVPYCVPQRPDLIRLKMLVKGRLSSAEDHLWLLREQPDYFWVTLREWVSLG